LTWALAPEPDLDAGAARFARGEHEDRGGRGERAVRRSVVQERLGTGLGQRREQVIDRGAAGSRAAVGQAKAPSMPVEREARAVRPADLQPRDLARPVRDQRARPVRIGASQQLRPERASDHEGPLALDAHVRRTLGASRVGAQREAQHQGAHGHGPPDAGGAQARIDRVVDVAHARTDLELAQQRVDRPGIRGPAPR
jgi:hypothetical protein